MLSTVPLAYIETDRATFRGPNGRVFADCTLTIRPSERWAVVGPNGSPSDTSAGDVYADRLARVRIRFP